MAYANWCILMHGLVPHDLWGTEQTMRRRRGDPVSATRADSRGTRCDEDCFVGIRGMVTAMAQLSAPAVRDMIIDRLVDGAYPIGSQLPTSRALATEIGANRNTVAKAYRQLANLGLVTVRQGRGTFVAALIEEGAGRPLVSQIEERLADQIIKARRLGLSEPALRAIFEDRVSATYGPVRRGLFVECNTADIEAAISEIESLSGIRLMPLLLHRLGSRPRQATEGYDVVVTSLFHIKEVSAYLTAAGSSLDAIGVYTRPDEEALNEIARIHSGSRVGIIVSSGDGAQRFANQINMVTTVATKALVLPENDAIRHLSQQIDAIVYSRSRARQIASLALPVPVIELRFHVSPQSLTRLTHALVPASQTS